MSKNVGDRIREARKNQGLSATELAAAVGVSRATIYRYENNEIEKFPLDALVPVAKALNVSPAWLMGWEDEESNQQSKVSSIVLDDDILDLIDFLHKNPDYKVLFDASRKIKPEDIEFVKKMIEKMGGSNE